MEWPMVEAKSGTNPVVFGAVKSGFRVFCASKPRTIPVAEIREIWEAASKKGRYTNKAIWAACAKELEEYQAMAAAQSSQHKQ